MKTLKVDGRWVLMADEDGRWVTIRGTPVFIGEDGTVKKGPKGVVGKKPSELRSKPPTPHGKGSRGEAGESVRFRLRGKVVTGRVVDEFPEDDEILVNYKGKNRRVHFGNVVELPEED